jgi:hypothetical protein
MKRLKVEAVREIKRHVELGLSDRKIALTLRCSRNTVAAVRKGKITEESVAQKSKGFALPVSDAEILITSSV